MEAATVLEEKDTFGVHAMLTKLDNKKCHLNGSIVHRDLID